MKKEWWSHEKGSQQPVQTASEHSWMSVALAFTEVWSDFDVVSSMDLKDEGGAWRL